MSLRLVRDYRDTDNRSDSNAGYLEARVDALKGEVERLRSEIARKDLTTETLRYLLKEYLMENAVLWIENARLRAK